MQPTDAQRPLPKEGSTRRPGTEARAHTGNPPQGQGLNHEAGLGKSPRLRSAGMVCKAMQQHDPATTVDMLGSCDHPEPESAGMASRAMQQHDPAAAVDMFGSCDQPEPQSQQRACTTGQEVKVHTGNPSRGKGLNPRVRSGENPRQLTACLVAGSALLQGTAAA